MRQVELNKYLTLGLTDNQICNLMCITMRQLTYLKGVSK